MSDIQDPELGTLVVAYWRPPSKAMAYPRWPGGWHVIPPERRVEFTVARREDIAVAIQDILLLDSPEGDSPRNIAANLRLLLDD